MSLQTIRDTYKVPAYKGTKVKFIERNETKIGVIVNSAYRDYLLVEVDGRTRALHPTFNITYITD